MPGHHAQVDVEFLFFKDAQGNRIKRVQYTAIDNATRIRVLKIYVIHTQATSIDFINYIGKKFPQRKLIKLGAVLANLFKQRRLIEHFVSRSTA